MHHKFGRNHALKIERSGRGRNSRVFYKWIRGVKGCNVRGGDHMERERNGRE